MKYQIVECSEKAKALIKADAVDNIGISDTKSKLAKYPYSEMEIGKGFAVPYSNVTDNNIRLSAYRAGKQMHKTFTVIKHDEHQCYEVARIA